MVKRKFIAGLAFTILLMAFYGVSAFKKDPTPASKEFYPTTFALTGSTATYCPSASASAITANSTNASCNNGSSTYVTVTVNWYQNTSQSQVGSTLVQTTSGAASVTSYTYTPPTSSNGTLYYYATISWSAGAVCAPAGSITTGYYTVIVTPPTLGGILQAATVCPGSNATINLTGLMASTTQQISYSINGVSQTPKVITSTSSGTGSFTVAVTSSNNGQPLTVTKIFVNSGCTTNFNNSTTLSVYSPPSITTQPSGSSQNLCKNGTPTDLSISASAGSGTISTYQWYSNTTTATSGGTLVATHANSSSTDTYTPVTSSAGTLYYYCVITNSNTCSVTSSISGAIVVANTSGPNITTQPSTATQNVCLNGTVTALSISASGGGGTTYQWYSSPNSNGSSSTLLSGATSSSYTPLTTSLGTLYYYCVATNGCSVQSNVSGAIIVSANNTSTLSSAAGTDAQTVCINAPITNITYATTGATGATFSGLPAGVTGNWASNVATISGTPTASGLFSYTVTLTGGCGSVASNGSINVSINTSTLTSAVGTNAQTVCINTAITNITYATTGATGATFSGLPAGVTGNWATNVATISGTPTASGTFNYTVTLTGGCGTVTSNGSITVNPNNTSTLSSAVGTNAQTVCINSAIISITYATTGATGANFSGLPSGVTGNWAANVATISGTPTASGTFNYTVTLTGGCGLVTSNGSITVSINTSTLSSAAGTDAQTVCINAPITNITYATTGATGANFSGLPAGVTGNWAANVATISGTPTASGTFNYTVTLTGGCGLVTSNGSITVNINTSTLTSAAGTDAQTVCINAAITNITYATTGATGANFSGLPAGVTGNWAANVATISGTPTASGTFNYTVTLTGGCGLVTSNGSITVNINTSTLTSAAGTDAQTVCINAAITNITYATTGATGANFSGLPAGVTGNWVANVATISGTPTASGTFNYTVTLTGGCGLVTSNGSITVNINTSTLSSAAGTDAQTVCINAAITNITYATTGATGANFSGLPAGVTGNWAANVATISGTPTASGTFNYTVTLTGGCGSVTSNGSITVGPNNTSTLSSAAGTDAQTVCINAAITTITYATTGATGANFSGLPAGVTGNWASNTASISGTPTASGTFNYTVTLTGGCSSVTSNGSITVNINTSTLSSAAGTDAQTVCINAAITTITYATTGATGATFSGLPVGVTGSWAANVATISGTPTASGTFNYIVTLTGGCGSVTSSGSITISGTGSTIWTGNTSTNWSDATNWSCGLPSGSVDADIPFGLINYPVVGAGVTVSVKNLTMDFGSSLQLNSTSILQISGDFVNYGAFTSGGGTVRFNGSSLQNLGGSGTTVMTFDNINVTNTTSPVSVSIESDQNLKGVLTLSSNSTFDADGSAGASVFTLLSTSDLPTVDASIATLPTGASVIGNVTVQRYMGRSGSSVSYHVYRDISAPVNTTVSDMQNSLPVTGPFTNSSIVTFDGTTPDGTVDYTVPSLTYYNEAVSGPVGNGWTGFPANGGNTTTSFFVAGKGYSLFVFGSDFPVLQNGNAKWSLTGAINSGTVNMPVTLTKTGTGGTYNSNTDGWNFVGNPYPSTIDWSSSQGWTKTKINNAIYIDDFSSGSDVFASYVNGVSTNGGSRYIAMGQGFWVKANALSPALAVDERVKVGGQQTSFYRESSKPNLLRVTLLSGPTDRDETVIYFDNEATEGFDDQLDADKLMNRFPSFNLSSVSENQRKYAINSMPLKDCSRKIFLDISDVKTGTYDLKFSDFESMPASTSILLKDNLKNSVIDVRQNRNYSFEVDLANTATYGSGRFNLIFNFNGSTANNCDSSPSVGISAFPNPVKETITIETSGENVAFGEVYNSLGLSMGIFDFVKDGNKQSAQYDFGKEVSGVYFIKVSQGGQVTVIRVVKD